VFSFEEQVFATGKYYEAARRLLTAEVNAAVAGALEAGVEDVLVIDGHGCGGIHYESLHEAARVMQGGAPWCRADLCAPLMQAFDVTAIIGQHAMEGAVEGNLNHSQSSQNVAEIRLNGKPIGELAQWALFCGAFGIPLIFVSGDHAACREAEALIPGIPTAAVKQGLSRGSAISLSAPGAHAAIREGIAKAVHRHQRQPIAPLKWPGPYRLEYRMKHTHPADEKERQGWTRVDAYTVALEKPHIAQVIYA
jgi:D-amino peptidase